MNHAPATKSRPSLFALLIGIDRYSQTPLSDGSYYPHLGGCVRDIHHVEEMLRNRLGLTDENIFKLISSNSANGQPVEPAAERPTYENLIKSFKDLTAQAQAGDQIYIHYSGHGGRSVTMFPELKGASGLDESLVPCDIGEHGACYLRDIEMAYLLKAMADKGLTVTLVLDSCHSGGATRGLMGNGAVRGKPNFIDTNPPPADSAVAAKEALLAAFQTLPPATTRGMNAATSGWKLPLPQNFVLLAACRANELANEYAFDGKERNGALTYWMLDALRQIGDGYTYKMLHNRIAAKVHAKFVDQTPQIEGDVNRELFGGAQIAARAAVNVVQVDPAKSRVKLNTGLAQGVGKGAQLAVYAANETDFTDREKRLAVVETEDTGATDTWAKIVDGERADEIQEGAQAVLLGVGIRLRGRVRLVEQENVFDAARQKTALENLRAAIETDDNPTAAGEKWIRLTNEGEETDFQVAINLRGEYEIWDANGRTLPNLRPALEIADKGALKNLVERLTHLTRYRNARLIDNTDPTSPLARKVVAELGTLTDPEDKNSFQSFGVPARPLAVGERSCLRVTNLSKLPVNVVIMDLQPDWGVSQAYPTPDDGQDYELLEPGADSALLLPMEAWLPEDYQEGADILKVFATVEGTSFHWLEMTALDEPPAAPKDGTRAPGDALEQLMAAISAPRQMRQMLNASAPKGRTWTTAQVEVRVRRQSIAHTPDPALSLLQAAFGEVAAQQDGAQKTRSVGGTQYAAARPDLSDPLINEITQYCMAVAQDKVTPDQLMAFDANKHNPALKEPQERGVVDTAKYCASMAVGLAKNIWDAKVRGNTALYDQYHAALTQKFGDCDLNYRQAVTQFLKFLKDSGHAPYRTYVRQSDFVIDGRLPADATVGIVADWGTGEPEALEVLRQVKAHNPQIAIHLGDIYYAGTEFEMENYFYQPWKQILEPEKSGILSLNLPGNHDMYAGGKPFYDMLDRLHALNGIADKPASYFCLRNKDWQIIGLDTALHDRLVGGATFLEDSEVVWVKDKVQNSDGRRTILMSHHQLFSANDKFDGNSCNERLHTQLKDILPQVDLWLWGHEHDLVVFDAHRDLQRGRCIGGSAFPVGNFEMPTVFANADVPVNRAVELSKGSAFYQHCYVIIKLDGAHATVTYYEDREGGRMLFRESL